MKESFASPAAVIKYLGAYTNRIAISNSRIKSISDGNVTFSWLDRRNGNVERLMTLPIEQFIRRFLLHIMPESFVRIRYFGFMSNRNRTERIMQCRLAITAKLPDIESERQDLPDNVLVLSTTPTCICPVCGKGRLVLIEEIPKRAGPVWAKAA
jgi:Putative transposase.